MSRLIEQVVDNETPLLEQTVGSCLFVGTPDTDGEKEAHPIDLLRALFYAVERTKRELPGRNTRVEVIGHMPRQLVDARGDVAKVLRESTNGPDGSDSARLLLIERTRVKVLNALVREFQLSNVEVQGFTDKLFSDNDALRDFIVSISAAQTRFGETLRVQKNPQRAANALAMKQALIELIPHWLSHGRDGEAQVTPQQLDTLIFYPLAELVRIMKKMTTHVGLFLPSLEASYLPVAQAYMKATGVMQDSAISPVDEYVRLTRGVEGLKLPRLPAGGNRKKPRLARSEAYRVSPDTDQEKARRVLLHPSDDARKVREKVLERSDLKKEVSIAYVTQMLLGTLRLLYVLSEGQLRTRRNLERALPDGLLKIVSGASPYNTGAISPELVAQHAEAIVDVFCENVSGPAHEAIGTILTPTA